jgi:hypothetical protein
MFRSKLERAEQKWHRLDEQLNLMRLEYERTGANLAEVEALVIRCDLAFLDWEDALRRHGGDESAWANFKDARQRRRQRFTSSS